MSNPIVRTRGTGFIPLLGYRCQRDAIRALLAQNLSRDEIAERTGLSGHAVASHLSHIKHNYKGGPKASAEPKALVVRDFIVSGVLPPSRPVREVRGETDTARRAREALARTRPRYRLKDTEGRFLHFSLTGFTDVEAWAWAGFARNLHAVLERHPEHRPLKVEVIKPAGGDFTLTVATGGDKVRRTFAPKPTAPSLAAGGADVVARG